MIEARGVPMLQAAFDDIIRRTGDALREALDAHPARRIHASRT